MTGPILLLDLNYTLAETPPGDLTRIPMSRRIATETYRSWLVAIARRYRTVLMTARPVRWANATLARIADVTGWQPQWAFFNEFGLSPPEAKLHALVTRVMPKLGYDGRLYLGLESNPKTRLKYAEAGIRSLAATDEQTVLEAIAAWTP